MTRQTGSSLRFPRASLQLPRGTRPGPGLVLPTAVKQAVKHRPRDHLGPEPGLWGVGVGAGGLLQARLSWGRGLGEWGASRSRPQETKDKA